MSTSWWRDAVVYQVYIRSFADSDGDGVGDLAGLRSRLPHLVSLGVDAVWVTPFYPSPMADQGYDVSDPMDVDPVFGDLAGFDALVAEAHAAGLRVLVDVVPNHSSSKHPWFVEALADPASPMRSRYLFRPGRGDGPPNDWKSVFGGDAWSPTPDGQWYLHLFDAGQPDLDWHSPDVHAYWLRILAFWLDRGVDGFRIDVAHGLYKRAGLPDESERVLPPGMSAIEREYIWDQDEVLAVYESWRALTDRYTPERMMVGEVFLFDVDRVGRYVGPHRLHQAFNFTVMQTPYDATALRTTIEKALLVLHPPTWVLSNHDLTRHATRYGGGGLGVRRGLSMTALMLALPGSPYLYQGEELGLEEADVPPEQRHDPIWRRSGHTVVGRDGCRTPMPWTAAGAGHGFTTGTPWLPFGPDSEAKAVDVQEREESSPLAVYRRLLASRRALLPGLGDGVTWLDAPAGVLALRRDGGLVCVLNTTGEDVEVAVEAHELLAATASGAELVATTPSGAELGRDLADGDAAPGTIVTVPAASTVWLR